MIKNKKLVSLIALALVCVVTFALSIMVIEQPKNNAYAETLFEESKYFNIEYDQSAPDGLDGKKGVKLTTNIDNRTIAFKGEIGGVFEVAFRPVAAVTGTADFTRVSFALRSNDSRYGME